MASGSAQGSDSLPARLVALCRPVEPRLVIAAIADAGFSAEAYLAADRGLQNALSDPGKAWAHFLLHGFAERRRFAINLRPEAIERLLALPVANRSYVVHLAAALTRAYLSSADLATRIVPEWPQISRLRALGAMPFLLLGSSDIRNYVQTGVRGERWLLPIAVVNHHRTAMSLGRIDAPSEWADRIRQFVQTVARLPGGRSIPCLLKFGQVDVEFAYNLSRVRDGRMRFDPDSFHDFCHRSVERYTVFLRDLATIIDRQRITVASIFPSSVSDDSWAGGFLARYAEPLRATLDEAEIRRRVRDLEIPDQTERVNMNRYYNSLLRRTAADLGLRFQDDFEILLDAYGVLDPAFTQTGQGRDCHLDVAPTRRELSLLLWELVDAMPNQAAGHDTA